MQSVLGRSQVRQGTTAVNVVLESPIVYSKESTHILEPTAQIGSISHFHQWMNYMIHCFSLLVPHA